MLGLESPPRAAWQTRTPWLIGLLLLAACGVAADEARAEVELSREWGPTTVSHHGGMTAWSSLDPQTGRYHLVVHDGQRATRLPIAPRMVPFDVDLGPDRNGDIAAVYSRCTSEPRLSERTAFGLPFPASGRGCDVYIYSLAAGADPTEQRITGASTRAGSEMLPSLWRNRVAFTRVYERRPGRRGRLPYLYSRTLGESPSRRQPGGPRGESDGPGPRMLDLYGRRLGFVWESVRKSGQLRSEIRLDTLREAPDVVSFVDSTTSTTFSQVTPVFQWGRLFWGTDCVGSLCGTEAQRSQFVSRHRLSSMRTGYAFLAEERPLVAAAPAADRTITVRAAGYAIRDGTSRCRATSDPLVDVQAGCRIALSDPLTFEGPRD